MKFDLSADTDDEAGIEKLLDEIFDSFEKYFRRKNYEKTGLEFFMVLICQPESVNLKQRKRFDKKDNVLYWDVMLPFSLLRRSRKGDKKRIIAEAIIGSVTILNKYKFGVDVEKIGTDVKGYFRTLGWIH